MILPSKDVIEALAIIKDWIRFNGEEYYIPDDAPDYVKEAFKKIKESNW